MKVVISITRQIHTYMKRKRKSLKLCPTLRSHGLYSPWNSPGQNTGVGDLYLLQGLLPTQVSRIAGEFFTIRATRGLLHTYIQRQIKVVHAMKVASLSLRDFKRDSVEEEMAPHSSILAWKIPWTVESGGLQSMGSQTGLTEQMNTHGRESICVRACSVTSVFAMPWTIALQESLSVGFSRQEYRSGLPCTPPGELAHQG